MTVAVPQVAAAAPLAQAVSVAGAVTAVPIEVSLTSDKTSFAVGETFSLLAQVTIDIQTSGFTVYLLDTTSGASVGRCGSSSSGATWNSTARTCRVVTSYQRGPAHIYRAVVARSLDGAVPVDEQAVSNDVTVVRQGWTVELSADRTVFAAGEPFTLSARVNQDIRSSGYSVYLVDVTAGTRLGVCSYNSSGAIWDTATQTCRVVTSYQTGPAHTYRAVVARDLSGVTAVEEQAVSSDVEVQREAWTVELSTDRTVFVAGETYTLSARVNQDIRTSGYSVYLVDATSGARLGSCSSYSSGAIWDVTARTCRVVTSYQTGPAHTYRAVIARDLSGVSPVDEQASSNDVTVVRGLWTVELSTDKTVFAAGETYTLSARVNQDIRASGYSVYLVDVTVGTRLGVCSYYSSGASWDATTRTCRVVTNFQTGPAHTYRAVVARDLGGVAPVEGQAVSNDVVVQREPWTVELSTDKTIFAAGETYTLSARVNQDIKKSGYSVYLLDVTTGTRLGHCNFFTFNANWDAASQTCWVTTRFDRGPAHTYRAVVARDHNGVSAVEEQAASNAVVTQRQAWTITLDSSSSTTPAGVELTLVATVNQDIKVGGGYSVLLVDVSARRVLGYCNYFTDRTTWVAAARTCTFKGYVASGYPHTYRAYVAQSIDPQTGAPNDLQASSNGFSAPSGGGPVLPNETSGGTNLSESCSQRCHGDPVNSVTGEFWESVSDLQVPGAGPGLSWSRSFATTRASTAGTLGYGWSTGYDIRLAPSGGSSLDSAPWVEVIQENGSSTVFTADGEGGFSAPLRVFATLERLGDGTYRFVRRGSQTFLFDHSGRLTRVEDRNGNGISISRDADGRIVRLDDGRGGALDITWSGSRISTLTDSTARTVTYTYSTAGDLTRVNLPDGSVKAYSYDTSHRVVSLTHPNGGVTRNEYDSANRVVSQKDPLGRITTFAYAPGQTTVTDPSGMVTIERYANGQVTSETKGAGTPLAVTTTFVYGPTNQVEAVTDPLGRVTRFTYDGRGNRTSATDPLGRISTTTYDGLNNPLTVTNPAGESVTFAYDERGNLLSMTDPAGSATTFTVNPDGTIATSTDALGRTTTYSYDARGFVAAVTGPDGAVVTTVHDALGRLVSSTDPRAAVPGADAEEFTSTFTYDAAGRRLTATDPLGAVVTAAYDAAGRPTSATDATGATTATEYDQADQVTAVVDAAGERTTFTYDAAGRVTTVTDPTGATTTTTYDVLGRATKVTDALGRVSRSEYDAGDRVTATVSPSGKRTTYTYDAGDQLLTVTDPLGKVTTTTYDQAGRPVTVTDADGRAVTTSYDRAGRPVKVLRADGSDLRWEYDATGQVTATIDAAGARTTYTYDAAGRRATATDTAGRTTTFEYDPAGLLTTLTQPDGAVTTYTYDAAGRRTGTDYSDETPDVSTVYDVAGRPTSVTDGTGTTTYAYDVLGRVLEVANGAMSVGYAWDVLGRLTELTYPGGQVVQREYDAVGQLTTVTDWANREYTYAYDADGLTEQIAYPNGVTTDLDRDANGQTLAVTTTGNGIDLLQLAYGYTDAGLLADQGTTRSTQSRAPPTTASTSSSFTWDGLARISQITGDDAGAFGFDAAGSVAALGDGRVLGYDAGRQLTSMVTPEVTTGAGAVTTGYTYDPRGNRAVATTDTGPGAGAVSHGYDQANRLTSVTGTDGTVTTYTYAATGLRATSTTGGTTEQYTWDTLASVPLLLTDATHAYVYGNGSVPLAQIDLTDSTVDYLHTDTLGSVRSTTDTTGAVTSDADYDTYGRPRAVTNSPSSQTTRFGYAGEYTDPTGYLYARARYYDPTTAQFLTRDPLEATTGNPYGYTDGNPLQYTDPLGLDWLQDAADWSASFGDTLTFGGTRWVREKLGVDSAVDYCSTFYTWGGIGGGIASLAPIGAGAFGAARLTSWGAQKAPALAAAITRATSRVRAAATQGAATIRQRLARVAWDDAGHINWFGPGSPPPPPYVSAGASLENIAVREAVRIQNAANLINRPIHLIGSRAKGTAGATSDWDYVVSGITSRIKHQLTATLPKGPRELGVHARIDILKALDEALPHITFFPGGG